MKRFIMACAAAVVAAGLFITAAEACTFHVNATGPTMADSLRQADTIVLARDDGRYRFEAVEALRGNLDGIEIPFLADTSVVRKLSSNPEDGVLFARDSDTGLWQRLAYVDTNLRAVLDDLLADIGQWPSEYDAARFQFFAALHDHPDPVIRRIAHRDLDRAPYALLRTLDLRLQARSILLDLKGFAAYQQGPFKYLLLGLSDEDAARQEILRVVAKADRVGQSYFLGPAATALIELDELEGLGHLEQLFLLDPAEPLVNVDKIVQALAVHGQVGSAQLQDRIGMALKKLVTARPETGPVVAKHLANTGDWSHVELMDKLLKSRQIRSFPEIVTVMNYLSQAKQAQPIE